MSSQTDNDKDMPEFKRIEFGKADAGKEKRTTSLLSEGFLDEGHVDDIVNGDKYFVFGPKGSGKSAIASRIELISKSDEGMVVHCKDINDFDFDILTKVGIDKETDDVRYIDAWKLLLSIELLDKFQFQKLEFKCLKRKYADLIKDLRSNGLLPPTHITHIMSFIKKRKGKVDVESNSIGEESTQTLISRCVDTVCSVNPVKKNILVIDGLDSILTNTTSKYQILSGLLHVANDLNMQLESLSFNSKIVVLCRTDVRDQLSDPDKTKYCIDSGITLDWIHPGADGLDDNALCRLIDLRASTSLGREVDVFAEFFPEKINDPDEKPTVRRLLECTRDTPRDAIQLMNFIQQDSRERATEASIKSGIKRYAEEYLIGEIKDGLTGFLSTSEIDAMFGILRSVGKATMEYSEIQKMASEKHPEMDALKVLSKFYEEGAIGNVDRTVVQENGEQKETDCFIYKYENPSVPFDERYGIVVHPALCKALNLR